MTRSASCWACVRLRSGREHGVFLEFDGRIKYQLYRRPGETLADYLMREKQREERICQETGWICIRIGWADLEQPSGDGRRIRAIRVDEALPGCAGRDVRAAASHQRRAPGPASSSAATGDRRQACDRLARRHHLGPSPCDQSTSRATSRTPDAPSRAPADTPFRATGSQHEVATGPSASAGTRSVEPQWTAYVDAVHDRVSEGSHGGHADRPRAGLEVALELLQDRPGRLRPATARAGFCAFDGIA